MKHHPNNILALKSNPPYIYLEKLVYKIHLDHLYVEHATTFCLSVFTSPQVYILPGQIPVTKLACMLCECTVNQK